MRTPRAELLAQKRDLEQKIAHIDTCLTMFCDYLVFGTEFLAQRRLFDNFQDAYDHVAENNRSLDRNRDKWYRSLLSIVAYQWTDDVLPGATAPDLVYPDIWDKMPNGKYSLNSRVFSRDCVTHSPFSDPDYQPTAEDLFNNADPW